MKALRTLGLAIGVSLALTVLFGAASASASQFRAEEYPATLNGNQTVAQKIKFKNGNLTCTEITASGTSSAASSEMTMSPAFTGCQVAGQKTTVSTNGCQYVFHSTNESAPYTGSMDISCGKGAAIELKSSGCLITIPAQTALGAVGFENSGSNRGRAVVATLSIAGLKYTEASGESCTSPGEHTDGSYSGGLAIGGFNNAAAHKVGVYLANEQIEDPALFEAESYPVLISGEGTEQMRFSVNMATKGCASFTVTGGGLSKAAADPGPLYPSFWGGCSVSANSCYFTLHATSSEAPLAAGTLGVGCKIGGDAIVLTIASCEIRFPAQSGLGPVQFENTGEGVTRGVHVHISTTSAEYVEVGAGCAKPGAHTNGALTGGWQLKGFRDEEGLQGAQRGIWVE